MDENNLVLAAQQGDETAETKIMETYKGKVRAIARTFYILGADKEDVVQEGMIGLMKAIRSFSPDKNASFNTYAQVCISRQIMDAVKAASRKKHTPLNESISLDEDDRLETIAVEYDNEEFSAPKFMSEIFEGKSGVKISAMEKDVCKYYLEGKSYSEIAEILGKSSKAVYNAMERFKQKMKKAMNQ